MTSVPPVQRSPQPYPVRPAAVAGMFYPGSSPELVREISEFLDNTAHAAPVPGFPKAVIVPHAGYVYSGAVAASAYDLLRPARGVVKRVVLLGPCHRVAVRGLALPAASAFDTPLGRVAMDQAAIAQIKDLPQLVQSAAVHAQEHALEVQLPFLLAVLGEFSLLPLAVGDATPEQVAQVLERLWGGPETLIVISSDLSHFHGYDEARAIDAATLKTILESGTNISHEQACGATPVVGMLLAARHHGMTPQLLDYRNSGDTAGSKDRVVGYASFRFVAPDDEQAYGPRHRQRALQIARESIGSALGLNPPPQWQNGGKNGGKNGHGDDAWLRELRASFITLKLDGELRGCIGSLQAHRSLAEDIAHNAQAAAFKDPRFGPLTREEFARITVEVSVLSPAKRLHFANHAELVRSLHPGLDGLILECGGRRGTFLPQVWEQLPDPEHFLAHLKNKAGLPTTTPSEQCKIMRYTVVKWSEDAGSDETAAAS